MKKISAVWAEDQNHLIGKNQTLPWHIPAELKHFKETTTGHVIVMGRVTFEGMGCRALPHRISIVLTQDKDYKVEDRRVLVFHEVDAVIAWFLQQDRHLYIIGGGQIFQLFAPYYDELVKTEIQHCFEGDTYFPDDFDYSPFEVVSQKSYAISEDAPYPYVVKIFKRKEKKG